MAIEARAEQGQLVKRAQRGDARAWHDLVDKLQGLVWSVVRGFRLSDAEAADVTQIVWLKAVEHIKNIREPERFGLWLATTARRESMRVIERQRRTMTVPPDDLRLRLTERRDFTEDQVDRSEARIVVQAMSTLSDDCQALLRLALADPPTSYADMSEILGIAVGTIGARRQRCLSRLRAASGL